MAPTLLGACVVARCDSCQLYWHVDLSGSDSGRLQALCSHCGEPMSIVDRDQVASAGILSADVVELKPVIGAATELKRGDLVALRWEDQLRVKRIAAVPGDIVSLDGTRLTVAGKRLEDLLFDDRPLFDLPWFLVDDESRREVSRWSTAAADPAWQRTVDHSWTWTQASLSSWLIYHHTSVYDHNRPSRVWDDYQINVGANRKLYGVDRLQVDATVTCPTPTRVTVAFWSANGIVLAQSIVSDGESLAVGYRDGVLADDLPVTPEHPVAIRVSAGPCALHGLQIERLIEYRIRPSDDHDQYPLQVTAGHCFVLGDNVPVSVDSRDLGLVPISRIMGLVTKRKSRAATQEIR